MRSRIQRSIANRVGRWFPARNQGMRATPSMGVAIDATSFRAVGTLGIHPTWLFEAERAEGQPLRETLAAFLRAAPARPRWRRRAVVFALADESAQLKRLTGLPSSTDENLLRELLAEDLTRFFATATASTRIGGLRVVQNGELWVTAYDAVIVQEIIHASERAGVRAEVVVPAAAVLRSAIVGEAIVWQDGARALHIRHDASGEVSDIRRTHGKPIADTPDVAPQDDLHAVSALAAAAPGAWRFADAYGAALSAKAEPTRLNVVDERSAATTGPWGIRTAAAACVLTLLIAGFAPGLRATRDYTRINSELQALSARRTESAALQAILRQYARSLDDLSRFDRGRRPTLPLLAAIAEHLPEQTAVTVLHVDTTGGSLVIVGSRVALAVPSLERAPGITAPEIVGPVSRERQISSASGGAGMSASGLLDLERLTVRFRRPPVRTERAR